MSVHIYWPGVEITMLFCKIPQKHQGQQVMEHKATKNDHPRWSGRLNLKNENQIVLFGSGFHISCILTPPSSTWNHSHW